MLGAAPDAPAQLVELGEPETLQRVGSGRDGRLGAIRRRPRSRWWLNREAASRPPRNAPWRGPCRAAVKRPCTRSTMAPNCSFSAAKRCSAAARSVFSVTSTGGHTQSDASAFGERAGGRTTTSPSRLSGTTRVSISQQQAGSSAQLQHLVLHENGEHKRACDRRRRSSPARPPPRPSWRAQGVGARRNDAARRPPSARSREIQDPPGTRPVRVRRARGYRQKASFFENGVALASALASGLRIATLMPAAAASGVMVLKCCRAEDLVAVNSASPGGQLLDHGRGREQRHHGLAEPTGPAAVAACVGLAEVGDDLGDGTRLRGRERIGQGLDQFFPDVAGARRRAAGGPPHMRAHQRERQLNRQKLVIGEPRPCRPFRQHIGRLAGDAGCAAPRRKREALARDPARSCHSGDSGTRASAT